MMTPRTFAGSEPGIPFVYFLTEPDFRVPFYVGECGQSASYNVAGRIRRHFHASGTMARVRRNMNFFGFAVPEEFDAYIRQLPDKYSDKAERQSLEGWVIHKLCHSTKKQHAQFCVTKYSAPTPTSDAGNLADQILSELYAYS